MTATQTRTKKTNAKGSKEGPITLPREGGIGDRLALVAKKREVEVIDLMASTPATMAIEVGDIPTTRVAMADIFTIPGFNSRSDFGNIKALAVSIHENGLDNPLTVIRKTFGKRTVYGILAGERRFRALASLRATHVSVRAFEGSSAQARDLRELENFQRLDLSHWEKAELCVKLRTRGLTLPEVGKRVGKSGPWVSNMVAVVTKLDPEIYKLWKKYPNAVRVATRICRLSPAEQVKEWNNWIRKNEDPEKGKRKNRKSASGNRLSPAQLRNHVGPLAAMLGVTPGGTRLSGSPHMTPSAEEYWTGVLFGIQLSQGERTFARLPKKYVTAYVAAEKRLNKARERAAARAAKE